MVRLHGVDTFMATGLMKMTLAALACCCSSALHHGADEVAHATGSRLQAQIAPVEQMEGDSNLVVYERSVYSDKHIFGTNCREMGLFNDVEVLFSPALVRSLECTTVLQSKFIQLGDCIPRIGSSRDHIGARDHNGHPLQRNRLTPFNTLKNK